jgi:hypothetical protein
MSNIEVWCAILPSKSMEHKRKKVLLELDPLGGDESKALRSHRYKTKTLSKISKCTKTSIMVKVNKIITSEYPNVFSCQLVAKKKRFPHF